MRRETLGTEGFLDKNFPFLSSRARSHWAVFTKPNSISEPSLISQWHGQNEAGKQAAEEEAVKMNKSLFRDNKPHTMNEGGYEALYLEEGDVYLGAMRGGGNPYDGPEGYVGAGVYRHGINDFLHKLPPEPRGL